MKSTAKLPAQAQNVRYWRTCTDEHLLADCRLEAFRGPGPGGQKRNKTSSAVRLVHEPTGIAATAMESRSQALNRRRALERLRKKMTLEMRDGFDEKPEWFEESSLKTSKHNVTYWRVLGVVLDALEANDWSVSDAAAALGVNTAKVISFLESDEEAWGWTNQHRARHGLKNLR
jgi:hypothetical protein